MAARAADRAAAELVAPVLIALLRLVLGVDALVLRDRTPRARLVVAELAFLVAADVARAAFLPPASCRSLRAAWSTPKCFASVPHFARHGIDGPSVPLLTCGGPGAGPDLERKWRSWC